MYDLETIRRINRKRPPAWKINVYSKGGRLIGPLLRPCNGKNRPNGLEWKLVVYLSFKRALLIANQRTLDCATANDGRCPLLHNVAKC